MLRTRRWSICYCRSSTACSWWIFTHRKRVKHEGHQGHEEFLSSPSWSSCLRVSIQSPNRRRSPMLPSLVRPSFGLLLALAVLPVAAAVTLPDGRYLYVVCPGIRNYLEFGGAGILVFDIDNNHKFVKRIKTPASAEAKPLNIKGVCASAVTKRLYFSTLTKLYCVDLLTEKTLW